MATLETTPALSCCACSSTTLNLEETHYDRHANTLYRLYGCAECGVVFSEPRQAVGADWYQQAVPLETPPSPEEDGRFRLFFEQGFPAGKLLDVGCGEGGFLSMARDQRWQTVGFDYDQRKVEEVRGRGLEAHASDWLSFCRSRAAGEFDAITLFDVLEHVPEPRELVREAKRLLKSGGHLVVTLPNARRPLPFGREEFDFPPHHFTRWTPQAMKAFLEREGLSVTSQDAGTSEWTAFLDTAATQLAVKPALRLAKRLLFKSQSAADAPVSELAQNEELPDALADKELRSRLFAAFSLAAKLILAGPVFALWLALRLVRRDGGQILFTSAVKA
jgi:2-polyprenyl-3-methyl-5-hydroxy-6-metoxy-1,4-benzoquinol methylase